LLIDDYATWSGRVPAFQNAPVGAVIAAPILWLGESLGVLWVEHEEAYRYASEDVEVVTLFAEQAAAAIANARLFDDLERANAELEAAYDATLEGWVHALDLRDRETEGHTQRVSRMTVELARAMGVEERELVHFRRGAMLHDIGKIAVPDQILFKPGPLTEEERGIMQRHTGHANAMLARIGYLRPALDIPFCHHEWWDGSGYPRGLSGEEIPLAARVFAVVDVWDALTSDRPYRRAWPPEKVRRHIEEGAGSHFDPRVVAMFFATVCPASVGPPATQADP
jgi:HD-GYP domain-containing protein (c-di-GMP phosphodiesterase class II)